MKKLFSLFIALIFCTLVKGQEQGVIKISTSVIHKDASPVYKATVVIGSGYSSLPSEVMTIESLKTRYKEELEKAGFSFNTLKENPNGFGYETLAHKKAGLVYEYTTTSIADIKQFMKIRPLGVESIYVVSLIEIDTKETLHLTKLAIGNAKEKASAIAHAMGKKLGEIIQVEDIVNRWGNTIEASVYYDRPPNECLYTLDVTFKIEE